ncbi:MAG: primosomal protein N' [Lachnospiraceae bacterium]|nr:primosomal protein N' [Lachnospiraceae bacterium]
MFADVIIDIANKQVDRPFTYCIPEHLSRTVSVGSPVLVPFGKGNALRKGYVISLKEASGLDDSVVKSIDSVPEKGLSVEEQLLQVAIAMRHRYGGTLYQCLSVVMPAKSDTVARKPRYLVYSGDRSALEQEIAAAAKKKHYAKLRLFQAFLTHDRLPSGVVSERLNVSSATLSSLVKAGTIRILTDEPGSVPNAVSALQGTRPKALNEDQQAACRMILSGEKTGTILFGVTGSGKTEVYIALIEEMLKRGKEAIVLIPEIALTYQTVMRFYDRFGEQVSVVHSRLSKGEKAERFQKAKNGELKVMIGPRSALFTPFRNLGLIVVDEFHEPSYRSDQVPKYDAVELALYRAKISGAKAVLGSASPLVEQFRKTETGELDLICLPNRAVPESALPSVTVVDMREELKKKNRSVFSMLLREKIADRIEKKEQIMLFLNRRGYSGAVSCRSCGKAVQCPHCSVSLNYHKGGVLKCHFCGYERPMIRQCPSCGSTLVGTFGVGTEKVEELIQAEFPGVRTLRMDADTTSGKNGHQEILERFALGEADVLVGTQMIVKGHDFPNVTLVGILAADLSLFVPDFRSAERTFDLLLQAEGRAGRRNKPGECIIQTYNPEHYAVSAAKNCDFRAFYNEEVLYRRQLSYPPEGAFLCVRISGKNEDEVRKVTEEVFSAAKKQIPDGRIRLIGPAEDEIKKIKDSFRYVFYIKGPDSESVLSLKDRIEKETEQSGILQKTFLSFEF